MNKNIKNIKFENQIEPLVKNNVLGYTSEYDIYGIKNMFITLETLYTYPNYIKYIKNPSWQFWLEAFKHISVFEFKKIIDDRGYNLNGKVIFPLEYMTEKEKAFFIEYGKRRLVSSSWKNIEYIENPSYIVQKKAIKQNGRVLKYTNKIYSDFEFKKIAAKTFCNHNKEFFDDLSAEQKKEIFEIFRKHKKQNGFKKHIEFLEEMTK